MRSAARCENGTSIPPTIIRTGSQTVSTNSPIGFIGLGVMGEPMCRNLARQSGRSVIAFDQVAAPLERLAPDGVRAASGIRELARQCGIVFMALPSGAHVEAVCSGADGLLSSVAAGTLVADPGPSRVVLPRDLSARFAAIGARYADARIARTRQAAEDGTLSIMVGADEAI